MPPRSRLVRTLLTSVTATALTVAGAALGTAPAHAGTGCEVTYTTDQWGAGSGGFTAGITVENTGDPLKGWTLTFTFPGSQQITQGWSGDWHQSGHQVTVENPSWGGVVPSGGSFETGFLGTWTGSNPPPTDFAVNGVPCGGSPGPGQSPGPGSPVDNPFADAVGYADPDWAADVEYSAARVGEETAAKMRGLKQTPTAIWLDSIASVTGGEGAGRTLADHLDAAVAQSDAAGQAIYVTLVLYDLPDRHCQASWYLTSELHAADNGLQRYKTEYIDAIADILGRPEYSDLRIATIIEPWSLSDLSFSSIYQSCNEAMQSGVYQDGIRYALDTLSPLPNVYTYLDAGDAGRAGWDIDFANLATLITQTVSGTAEGTGSVDGIATDVADYVPVEEPFLPDPDLTVTGIPLYQSRFYDWNPYFDELDYATALRSTLIANGFPSGLGVVIDTSRNGWGGPHRPTAVSTSTDVNTYVDESRIDRRPSRGATCNQNGAGLGARPVAAPAPGIDAYLWIKRPGESDGVGGPTLPPGYDQQSINPVCDPTGSLPPIGDAYRPTNALPDAPPAGEWHHEQFVMLVDNAYPAL